MKKPFLLGFLLVLSLTAKAQEPVPVYFEKAGLILRATASGAPANRYSLSLFQTAGEPYHWDITLPDDAHYRSASLATFGRLDDHFTSVYDVTTTPARPLTKGRTIVRATLHQYTTYEEKLTFKNLALAPVRDKKSPAGWMRFLAAQPDQTLTTPSGITVTLDMATPLSDQQMSMAGNGLSTGLGNELYIPLHVTPNTKLVRPLPDSPLFRQHGRAVTIKLEVTEPYYLLWPAADNTFRGIQIGLPKLHTIDHLDELTIIVRQRVELQTVPISLEVPVSKS